MNLEIFTRQLQLLQLLTGNTELTVRQICEQLDISVRTFHRYVAMFRAAGFEVNLDSNIYSILHTSPFYTNVSDKMQLRSSEVSTMVGMLNRADPRDPSVAALRRKFTSIYGVDFSEEAMQTNQHIIQNTTQIERAIRQRHVMLLHDYESPHRQTLSDRLVEPFRILSSTGSVRCYEPSTDTCKTFKIARIRGEAEVLPGHWKHMQQHKNYYVDPFGFSGEQRHRVALRLSLLASQILCEEFGVSEAQLLIDPDNQHRLFYTYVCSDIGIGRFVMGLLGEVEVVSGPSLKQYIQEQIKQYAGQEN